jgi:hypothetical protein
MLSLVARLIAGACRLDPIGSRLVGAFLTGDRSAARTCELGESSDAVALLARGACGDNDDDGSKEEAAADPCPRREHGGHRRTAARAVSNARGMAAETRSGAPVPRTVDPASGSS